MNSKLTPKQAAFVQEYLVDLCATQAAIRAGYSKKTANRIGPQNLSKLVIQVALKKAMDARAKETGVTAESVLRQCQYMSFADIRELFTEAGQLIDIRSLPDAIAAAVQSVEVVVRATGETDEDGNREVEHVHKIRLVDKRASLDMLFKHLGLYNDTSTTTPGGVHITMNYGPPDGRQLPQGVTVDAAE